MKVRNTIIFIVVAAIILVGAYAVFFDMEFGTKIFSPLGTLVFDEELSGGTSLFLEPKKDSDGNEVALDEGQMKETIGILKVRLKIDGYNHAQVWQYGKNGIHVELPINSTSTMRDASQVSDFIIQRGDLIVYDAENNELLVREDFEEFQVAQNTLGNYVVYTKLTKAGSEKLSKSTTELIDSTSASETDKRTITVKMDGETLTSFYITEPITEGTFGFDAGLDQYQTTTLVDLLNSGMLPVTLEEDNSQATSAPMYAGAKTNIMLMLVVTCAILAVVSLIYMRAFGIAAALSMLCYGAVTIMFVSMTRATVSAASIFAVLVGFAYLVISLFRSNSQFKREYESGKNLRAAFKSGYATSGRHIFEMFSALFFLFLIFIITTIYEIRIFSYALGISILVAYLVSVLLQRWLVSMLIQILPGRTGLYFSKREEKEEVA